MSSLNVFDRVRHKMSSLYRGSRRKKFTLFEDFAKLKRGDTILDVGVNVNENNPFENLLEKELSDEYAIIAVTLDDPRQLKGNYPNVKFLQADGRHLPFQNGSFDTLFSNAVIEHVGKEEDQRRFAMEAVRVARIGMITTPNFWFPIEVHTTLPLVHYLPWFVRKYIFRFLAGRSNEEYMSQIRLLSSRAFRRLFSPQTEVHIEKMRVTVWPESLIAYFRNSRKETS